MEYLILPSSMSTCLPRLSGIFLRFAAAVGAIQCTYDTVIDDKVGSSKTSKDIRQDGGGTLIPFCELDARHATQLAVKASRHFLTAAGVVPTDGAEAGEEPEGLTV